MKKIIPLTMVAALAAGFASANNYNKAEFEDNEIRLYSQPLAYEVLRDGNVMVAKTEISLTLDGKVVGKTEAPVATSSKRLRGKVDTPVYKKAKVDLSGRETYVDYGNFAVRLVAREDGVAYRFETKAAAVINYEDSGVTIPSAKSRVWCNKTGAWSYGCEETTPTFIDAGKLYTDNNSIFYMPFVYSVGDDVVAVTESDVVDYPIWNFKAVTKTDAGVKLSAEFVGYPKRTSRVGGWGASPKDKNLPSGGRWIRIDEHEKFLVKSSAGRALPWRTFILADDPKDLCENDIVFALARPQDKGADFSWVKPGKVAWDWWNGFDNQGDRGCNTKTYERFIDFAAKTGVEYVIFDEGWSASLNIWEFSKNVDVPYLINYANKKGVGIILWMAWAQVYGVEEKVAEHFAKLGAKGFKVDFMDRGDAEMAVFLEKFAAACAKHKMVVDYHGVYRPVGLHRKYPNILNYEGIHGLEQLKWGRKDSNMPYNDVACTFLRMTAGPMDYTPGAMDNYPMGDYRGNYANPGSVGTRCHQMALMALYEAPLQMLADSPTKYEKNMECFSFMAQTPVVWADTKGLGGHPESHAVLARKAKDGSWYVAGITDKNSRVFNLDTDFLGKGFFGPGTWKAEIFRDASDSDTKPQNYVHETKTIKAGEKFDIPMAKGGGFVIRFTK